MNLKSLNANDSSADAGLSRRYFLLGAGVVSAPEDVIVINGAAATPGASAPASPPPANTPPAPAPAPAPPQNGNANGAYVPELIHDGRGSYTPDEQQRP